MGFPEGLPLFKLIFFSSNQKVSQFKKLKINNKNRYFMFEILTSESYTHPPTSVNLTQTVARFYM